MHYDVSICPNITLLPSYTPYTFQSIRYSLVRWQHPAQLIKGISVPREVVAALRDHLAKNTRSNTECSVRSRFSRIIAAAMQNFTVQRRITEFRQSGANFSNPETESSGLGRQAWRWILVSWQGLANFRHFGN